ncbi:MAG: hypothetical protein KJ939_07925 [Nanoarchaeota archaeon]|nr:hypothetical protein [Nanoarchaeota archaeon]
MSKQVVIAAVLLTLLIAPVGNVALAAGSNCDGSEGVYLYENINYQGRCSKFTGDSSRPEGWSVGNDAASSIRIVGYWTATVYEHADFLGTSSTSLADDPNLSDNAIGNYRVSSIRVQRTEPRQMGSQIVARAKIWVDKPVPYNQQNYPDGYRADCSGFASYAWQVKNNTGKPDNPDVIRLANDYGVYIPFDALQPGDIIANRLSGDIGHVVIFVRWISTGSRFEAYEENGNPDGNKNTYDGRAIKSILTLTRLPSGGITIAEYESFAPGPYYAYRYKNIPGFVNVVNGLRLSSTLLRVNDNVTALFQIRNDGGQTTTIAQLTAGARGPGANNKGWNAPVVDFPIIKNIVLQPGQSYDYSQTRSFSMAGDYFAEPVKDQNGWGGIYPWPRVYFSVR